MKQDRQDREDEIVLGVTMVPWGIGGALAILYFIPPDEVLGVWGTIISVGVVLVLLLCAVIAVCGIALAIGD